MAQHRSFGLTDEGPEQHENPENRVRPHRRGDGPTGQYLDWTSRSRNAALYLASEDNDRRPGAKNIEEGLHQRQAIVLFLHSDHGLSDAYRSWFGCGGKSKKEEPRPRRLVQTGVRREAGTTLRGIVAACPSSNSHAALVILLPNQTARLGVLLILWILN